MKLAFLYHLSIDQKSLLLAILIHIIISELFIFSVPEQKISGRPFFIFWGSFLGPIDPNALQYENASPEDTMHMPIFQDLPAVKQGHEFSKPPMDYAQTKHDKKTSLKTTFLEDEPGGRINDNSYGKKAEYQPLRLSSPSQ